MGHRRQAREAALSYLYQKDFGLDSGTNDPQRFVKYFFEPPLFEGLFKDIVQGLKLEQEEIDQMIQEVADHWKLGRMERIDRVILRIATWELKHALDTPVRVIIDEAVEIAKKFSTTESARFVNGLLDQLAKKLRKDELASPMAAIVTGKQIGRAHV